MNENKIIILDINKKVKRPYLLKLFAMYGQEGGLHKYQSFPDWKWHEKMEKPRVSGGERGYSFTHLNSKGFFPDVRVPPEEFNNWYRTKKDEIAKIHEEIDARIREEYMAWEFLTFKEAIEDGEEMTPARREQIKRVAEQIVKGGV